MPFFFGIKKKPASAGEEDEGIRPAAKESEMSLHISSLSGLKSRTNYLSTIQCSETEDLSQVHIFFRHQGGVRKGILTLFGMFRKGVDLAELRQEKSLKICPIGLGVVPP